MSVFFLAAAVSLVGPGKPSQPVSDTSLARLSGHLGRRRAGWSLLDPEAFHAGME